MRLSELQMFIARNYKDHATSDDPEIEFYTDRTGRRLIFTDTVYTDDGILCFDMEEVSLDGTSDDH